MVYEKKRIGILTGGGDVAPLNAVIYSARDAAIKNNYELIGFKNGWQGMLNDDYVSLTKTKIDPLIGGTILKSSRVNLAKVENGPSIVQSEFEKLHLDGLVVIGGEDTLSNAFSVKEIPQVLISKTIDNDVGINNNNEIVNYFTLGHPTAAEKISSFVSLSEGLRTTAYSHERIMVVESMGMHAGWLALSSSMGHPDFIIIPEFTLDYSSFVKKVVEKYSKQKNLIIVVAEGARWSDGSYISADESEKDSFGHPRFKGAANLLAEKMKNDLKNYFDTRNVNSVNPSYMYRSGKPNNLDISAATKLGATAVNHLKKKNKQSIFLTTNFNKEKLEVVDYSIADVENIDKLHRFVTDQFYDPFTLNVTRYGKKYLSKIVNEFPKVNYRF